MKSPIIQLLLPCIVIILIGSCSSLPKASNTQTEQAACFSLAEAKEKQAELDRGIRTQVKFVGEPEQFSSIADKLSDYNIPALSLAVINQGKVEWTETYVNTDFPEEQGLDCHSLFQTASLSKPVTVLAALRMQAEGEIDLDRNIQDYLQDYVLPPGKQTADNPVTMRNIFSHSSGITAGGYEGYARGRPLPSDIDVLKGREGVNSPAIEVVSAPNEVLAYSGGAYTLAEVALQDIFKDEFSNIMQEWILEPAGMKHSEFTQPLPSSVPNGVAHGYTQSGEMVEGGWRNHPEQAAAGLWSTSADMAKFLIEIYNAYQGKRSIFSTSDIESMISQERDGLAYGFILNRSGDDISITHYGGNIGYRTGMTISLTSGNGLVYLINSDNGGALGNELLLSASQVYGWEHFRQTEATRTQVSPDDLMPLAGDYKWNKQVDVSIRYDESSSSISLIFPNGDAYELTPILGEELDFIHAGTGVTVSFLQKDDYNSFKLYGQTAVKLDNTADPNE